MTLVIEQCTGAQCKPAASRRPPFHRSHASVSAPLEQLLSPWSRAEQSRAVWRAFMGFIRAPSGTGSPYDRTGSAPQDLV